MPMFDFIEDEELRAKAQAAHDAAAKTALDEVTKTIDTKINEATAGLKTKNDELLGEKQTFKEKLAKFADITDPEKALEALKFINENEDAQMIKDGKIGELIEKRTSQMRSDHTTALEELQTKLVEMTTNSEKYHGMYDTKIIEDSLRAAAVKAGVRTEAIPDILMRGRNEFTLDDSNTLESRDAKGNLKKNEDNIVITPNVWIDGLKAESPHYWPGSESGEFSGGAGGGDSDLTAKLNELAKKGDMVGFNKLRKKMTAN